MINLLPPLEKKELQAARTNVLLIRYNLLILVASMFLAAVLAFAYFYLSEEQRRAENTILDNKQKEGAYATIKADAATFQRELNDAKTVLDSQISYSTAVARLSALLPEGAAIKDRLELNALSFTNPTTLLIAIQDQTVAGKLLENFASSPYMTGVNKGKVTIEADKTYAIEVTFTLKREIALP